MPNHLILCVAIGVGLVASNCNGQIEEQWQTAGDSVYLECPTTAEVVEWRVDGWDTQATLIATYIRSNGTGVIYGQWNNGDVAISQRRYPARDVLTIKVKYTRDNNITIFCVEAGFNRKVVKRFFLTVWDPPSVDTVEGQTVTLKCENPALLIRWHIRISYGTRYSYVQLAVDWGGGTILYGSDYENVTLTHNSTGNYLTLMPNYDRDDGKTIVCLRTDDYHNANIRTVWSSYKMRVYGAPLDSINIAFPNDPTEIVTGDDIILRDDRLGVIYIVISPANVAVSTGDPIRRRLPYYTWAVNSTIERYMLTDEGWAGWMTRGYRKWHGLTLNCTVYYKNREYAITKTIIVHYGPNILYPRDGQVFVLIEGDTFALTLEYEARPDFNITDRLFWYIGYGKYISSNETLTIPSITREQGGTYSVYVSNRPFGTSGLTKFKIDVTYPPLLNVTQQPDAIECIATPGHPPNFTHFVFAHIAQNITVRNVTGTEGETNLTLPYDASSYEDNGVYRCVAANAYNGTQVGETVVDLYVVSNSTPPTSTDVPSSSTTVTTTAPPSTTDPPATTRDTPATCPEPFQHVTNACYYVSTDLRSRLHMTWEDARKECLAKGNNSDLVSFSSDDDFRILTQHISSQLRDGTLWTGATYNLGTKSPLWVHNGRPVPKLDKDLRGRRLKKKYACGAIMMGKENFIHDAKRCDSAYCDTDNEMFGYICQIYE